jgi:hypothetical protein
LPYDFLKPTLNVINFSLMNFVQCSMQNYCSIKNKPYFNKSNLTWSCNFIKSTMVL